jgi:hypothetical protein
MSENKNARNENYLVDGLTKKGAHDVLKKGVHKTGDRARQGPNSVRHAGQQGLESTELAQ